MVAAAVLAVGMVTTIATSPLEFRLGDSADVEREAGAPTTVVLLVDAETGAEGVNVQYDVTLTSDEDPGLVRLVPSDADVPAQEVAATDSGDEYRAASTVWSSPECFGGEWCSHVLTIETEDEVSYEVSVNGAVVASREFREDAAFVMEVE